MGLSLAAFPGPAAADDATTPTYIGMTQQDVGVMERQRPEFDAKGIPLGAFRIFPTMAIGAGYDDNVFKLPAASSDFYFEETPPSASSRTGDGTSSRSTAASTTSTM